MTYASLRRFASLACLSLMAACGGEDGSDEQPPPVMEPDTPAPDPMPEPTPDPMPDMTPDPMPEPVPPLPNEEASVQIRGIQIGETDRVEGAAVTYIRPADGDALVAFYLQALQEGPAIAVFADLGGQSPALEVGDIVALDAEFNRTEERFETTNLEVLSKGADVSVLLKEVSSRPDLVQNIETLENTLVEAEARITSEPTLSGEGFLYAPAMTFEVGRDQGLEVRLPEDIALDLGIAAGCSLSIGPSPLARRDDNAVLSVWRAEDLKDVTCATPHVEGIEALDSQTLAVIFNRPMSADSVVDAATQFTIETDDGEPLEVLSATVEGEQILVETARQSPGVVYTLSVDASVTDVLGSQMDEEQRTGGFQGFFAEVVSVEATERTELLIVFSREIDATTLTDVAGQFTFNRDLQAIHAEVSGAQIRLTTTLQTETSYVLTVADSVRDILGGALAESGREHGFSSFFRRAVLRINEFSATLSEGDGINCDLIELRVIEGGSLSGIKLISRGTRIFGPAVLKTFPDVEVQRNDYIVVHADANECNDGEQPAQDEIRAKDEAPSAEHPRNHDTAFDFWFSSGDGLSAGSNAFLLRGADNEIMDAVMAVNTTDCTDLSINVASERRASEAAEAGQWQRVGGGVPDGGFVDEDFCFHAVADLDATSAQTDGTSIQRIDDGDNNDSEDWSDQSISTWGANNAGQQDL